MHGIKPDPSSTQETADTTLQSLQIEAPTEVPAVEIENPLSQQPSALTAASRFEELRKQELAASSFSVKRSRSNEFEKHSPQPQVRQSSESARPLTKAKPLLRSRKQSAPLFEGLTVLDKLMSFVASLLKSLERGLTSLFQKLTNRRSSSPQTVQPLTANSEILNTARNRLKRKKTSAAKRKADASDRPVATWKLE